VYLLARALGVPLATTFPDRVLPEGCELLVNIRVILARLYAHKIFRRI
jgi:hypothetical protein